MEIPQIQIHEAKKKLDEKSSLFVDIRDPGSYQQAHIPGAIHLHDGNAARVFAEHRQGSKRRLSIAITATAAWAPPAYFIENGFTNVASMMGGFEAWRQVYEHEAGG